jgi:hypothetical protein
MQFPPVLVEAGKQFRRANGHLHLPAALERKCAKTVRATVHNDEVRAA